MPANPLKTIDDDVYAQLSDYTKLTTLLDGGSADIDQLDRVVDVREIGERTDSRSRIYVVPSDIDPDLNDTPETAMFWVSYDIGWYTGNFDKSLYRQIQFNVFRTLLLMRRFLKADGLTVLASPSPFRYEKFRISRTRVRRDPDDMPDNFHDLWTLRIQIAGDTAEIESAV